VLDNKALANTLLTISLTDLEILSFSPITLSLNCSLCRHTFLPVLNGIYLSASAVAFCSPQLGYNIIFSTSNTRTLWCLHRVVALGVICLMQHCWCVLSIYVHLHIHARHLDSSQFQ